MQHHFQIRPEFGIHGHFLEQVFTKLPMKRIGRPEDLVGPIVFLASEASSMITGLVLPVDGGAAATCPIEWRTEQ